MNTTVTILITPEELRNLIREEVSNIIHTERLLTRSEVAVLLNKSTQTIARMERKGRLIPVFVDGQPRYRESDIIKP